jgi:hypothetical protein
MSAEPADPDALLASMAMPELLTDFLSRGAGAGGITSERQKVAIAARAAMDLTQAAAELREAVDAAARASANLQRVLAILTAVAAVGAVVGGVATAWAVWW